jgi:cytidylate kinase
MSVVTLGGLTGGGGRLLGPKLAERLGSDYVDRLILTDAARHIGATVEALDQREQRPPTRGERFSALVQRILERSAVTDVGGDPYFGPAPMAFLTQEFEELQRRPITRGLELEDDKYIQAMRTVMASLADQDHVVIVGRGGAAILGDRPGVLRVGVVARLEDRIARIMERDRVDHDRAAQIVSDRDEARTLYHKRYFDIDNADDPNLYHIVLNTSDLDMDYACDLVVHASEAMDEGRLARKADVAL